jgi:hypothetical protein
MAGIGSAAVVENEVVEHAAVPERLQQHAPQADSGLLCLSFVARRFRIASDPFHLAHELGLGGRSATSQDVVRAAAQIGLKARHLKRQSEKRMASAQTPALLLMRDGSFAVYAMRLPTGATGYSTPSMARSPKSPPERSPACGLGR